MRVALINYAYSDDLQRPEDLLERYVSLTGWASGVQAAGAAVAVFQRFRQDAVVERQGVVYRFVRDRFGPRPRLWQNPRRLHRQVQSWHPAIVHINGLVFPFQTRRARALLRPCPIVVQDHAGSPWKGWRGRLQRWGVRAADGYLFCAAELAQPWLEGGGIGSPEAVFEIVEGSTWLAPQDRRWAQRRTGLSGAPLYLWVGRLDANKDPLTVLAGFAQIARRVPDARLCMIYSDDGLLEAVRAVLRRDPILRRSVELVGQVPHEDMVWYYSSADYFVLGSHREGSGYSLIEALACGVVPLVTNIPSFRAITGDGTLGALWPVGNASGLAAAGLALLRADRSLQSVAAKRFFAQRLSFPAIGRRAVEIYRRLSEGSGCPQNSWSG